MRGSILAVKLQPIEPLAVVDLNRQANRLVYGDLYPDSEGRLGAGRLRDVQSLDRRRRPIAARPRRRAERGDPDRQNRAGTSDGG